MQIRDIRKEEKELLFEMAKDFYSPATGACLHGLKQEHMENTFALCLTPNPYARMLVIEVDGEVQGFCLLSFTWSNEVGGMVVLVEELYFREFARGKGYGGKVLAWLEEEYPKARRFRLEVTYQNEGAIALYKKMGYQDLDYRQMVIDKSSYME